MSLIQLGSRASQTLQRIVHSSSDARQVRRAQVLLWLHRGERPTQVARRSGLTRQAIYALVQRYPVRQGQPVVTRIKDRKHPGRPPNKVASAIRVVRELLQQSPKRYRYRSPVGHLLRAEADETAEQRVDLRWWVVPEALGPAMQTDGRDLLVTNDGSLTPQRMFDLYRAKDGVEKCFRISQHVLQVRPLYVHSDERIEALLLINLLALLVYSLLERELRQHGLPWTTRRLIGQLENLTVIETPCWDGSVLCRLTPATDEPRQLGAFLARRHMRCSAPVKSPGSKTTPDQSGLK